jgi:hypothetical protein
MNVAGTKREPLIPSHLHMQIFWSYIASEPQLIFTTPPNDIISIFQRNSWCPETFPFISVIKNLHIHTYAYNMWRGERRK